MQKHIGVLLALIAVALPACSGGGNASPSAANLLDGVVLTTPSPTPVPTIPPTPAPNAVNVIVNPSFALGGSPSTATSPQAFLVGTVTNPSPVPVVVPSGWSVCQNLSEDQPADVVPPQAPSPNTFVQLLTTANLTTLIPTGEGLTQPFNTAPNTLSGSTDTAALMLGNVNAAVAPGISGRTKGSYGLCQQVVVPTGAQLTFWVNEGSGGTASTTTSTSEYVGTVPGPSTSSSAFGEGSAQEAAILAPSTAANPFTVMMPLFSELDLAQTNPAAYTNASNSSVGFQSGYVKKGPYDLSALAGKTVNLYFGIYSSSAATTSFTFMLVDDVNLSGFPATTSTARRPGSAVLIR